MAKRILQFFLLMGCVYPCLAQNINITDLEALGDSVIIRYDLQDESEERTYTVRIFALIDSDTLELTQIRGSGLGKEISPGSYELSWNALAELERFQGDLSFYITAVPSFFVDNPVEGQRVKLGAPITFQWFGGNSYLDSLTLELYQYDTPIDTIVVVGRTSQYTWKVPKNKSIKPGEGYRMKFMGTPLTDIEGFSNNFVIKGNTPLWAIIAPIGAVLAGTAAYLIWGRQPLPPPDDDGLPE
ncbi:MAG: hypothetical protein AAF696_17415 [Bacteroidota bacterium]